MCEISERRRRLVSQISPVEAVLFPVAKVLETEAGFSTFRNTRYRERRTFRLSVSHKKIP